MRAALVVALALTGCAARAPSTPASHPSEPAAKPGRLVGPPAIVRAGRASTGAPADPPPTPAHEHPVDPR